MNSNVSHNRRIAVVGRVVGLLVAAIAVVFAAQFVASWLAPIVAVPLLVASWVLGLGVVIFLPFAFVAAVAWVIAR